jgi:hypothetical protein
MDMKMATFLICYERGADMKSILLEVVAGFIITTFVIIAALAWNSAIMAVFMVVF